MNVTPEDVDELAELDEAFAHLSAVPVAERGAAWHAYADELLTKRLALAGTEQQRGTTRILHAPETR